MTNFHSSRLVLPLPPRVSLVVISSVCEAKAAPTKELLPIHNRDTHHFHKGGQVVEGHYISQNASSPTQLQVLKDRLEAGKLHERQEERMERRSWTRSVGKDIHEEERRTVDDEEEDPKIPLVKSSPNALNQLIAFTTLERGKQTLSQELGGNQRAPPTLEFHKLNKPQTDHTGRLTRHHRVELSRSAARAQPYLLLEVTCGGRSHVEAARAPLHRSRGRSRILPPVVKRSKRIRGADVSVKRARALRVYRKQPGTEAAESVGGSRWKLQVEGFQSSCSPERLSRQPGEKWTQGGSVNTSSNWTNTM
ncbi:hypothetical protein EYF80_004847 [Liparis tanakae]|uniref:Uncharacterized protein n=1 Tax=Liparis tanakae TaxID=230148 RepID=A0A4Z2J5N4_9TELE|nr:hypothetical protein EYF80_004847 [Liparis tanakae]